MIWTTVTRCLSFAMHKTKPMVRFIFSFCIVVQQRTRDEDASWDRHGLCIGSERCGSVLGEVVWKSPPCFCRALEDEGGEEDPAWDRELEAGTRAGLGFKSPCLCGSDSLELRMPWVAFLQWC